MTTPGIAFDRASVRSYDQDGRLRVKITNISKANVCPYNGSEIPEWEALGLDPNRVYMLLRDPEELAKAAPTFNSVPLMIVHKPTSAEAHPRMVTVGTTGSEASFEAPYLKNSLTVWDGEGIDLIESGDQKELSAGYHYRPDMTPGVFEGERYDGVMRDIKGNHIALVQVGRAGTDVVVGDENPFRKEASGNDVAGDSAHKESPMSQFKLSLMGAAAKGALSAYLRPKLAQDAKIDLNPLLKDVTAKNWPKAKTKLATDLKAKLKGKLAQDADVEDLVQLLDGLDGEEMASMEDADVSLDGEEDDKGEKKPKPEGMDDEEHSEVDEEALWRQLYKAIGKMLGNEKGGAMDDPPEGNGTPTPPDKKEKEPMVSKAAMDAAIQAARTETETSTIAKLNAIHEARETVRPLVGELKGAFDSASAVYKYALDHARVDVKGVSTDAYGAMVKMLLKARAPQRVEIGAMDSAGAADTAKELGALADVRLM